MLVRDLLGWGCWGSHGALCPSSTQWGSRSSRARQSSEGKSPGVPLSHSFFPHFLHPHGQRNGGNLPSSQGPILATSMLFFCWQEATCSSHWLS